MKVYQLNHSDINGGAARAAYRIHHALRKNGIDSMMLVDSVNAGDWTVKGPSSKLKKGLVKLRPTLGTSLFSQFFSTGNPIIHSASVLPSGRVKALNACDADVVHMHWVQGEMLSISEIGQLRKPLVYTLHDMWAFCGAEHYTEDHRWRDGYTKKNRPRHEHGFDINRWTWERKRKHWKFPMHIVTPSQWLAKCARESVLMRDWPVSVIPNPIDLERWKPIEKSLARNLLGLPKDVPLMLFGAMGGSQDPRKGFDLLQSALEQLHGEIPNLELLIFGQLAPKQPPNLGFPIHFTGHLHDDLSLRAMYSAADVFVLPSRQDNLPNTGVESLACGTPVVAFDTTGLPEIVIHQHNGYLAKAFDAEQLAIGIKWVMSDSARHKILSMNAILDAKARFESNFIAKKYTEIYAHYLTPTK